MEDQKVLYAYVHRRLAEMGITGVKVELTDDATMDKAEAIVKAAYKQIMEMRQNDT